LDNDLLWIRIIITSRDNYSEDLDFTLMDKNFPVDTTFINKIIKKSQENSLAGYYLVALQNQQFNDIPQGYKAEIKFWGADHNPNQHPLPPSRWQTSIHLDISFSEQIVLPAVERKIFHPYSDTKMVSNTAICYNFSELVAEKIRSLKQRNRPRDIYDVWYISKNVKNLDLPVIKTILLKKSEQKGLKISGISDFVNDEKRQKNKRAWNQSLSHQLPVSKLEAFDTIYDQLCIFITILLNNSA